MSVRSGHKTSREPLDIYNGYRIIKVTEIDYERSIFDPSRFTDYPKRKEVHYDFCVEGNEKTPSKHYDVYAKNVAECKERIDKFIEDDSTCFTAEERKKYVTDPNSKCGWGYGYDSLMKLLKEHKKATKRMKVLIEDRLSDANFHYESGLLAEGKYDEFEEFVTKDNPFIEKFEVYTTTLRKRIKDPKNLVEGLSKVINDYLASQGIKDTSVKVRFCEEW